MGFNVISFKHFVIIEESLDTYQFIMEQEGPWRDWSSDTFIELSNFFESKGITGFFKEVIPNFSVDIPYMDEETKNNIQKIIMHPSDCLKMLQEYELVERASEEKPDILEPLKWFQNVWEKGYNIIQTE